MHTQKIPPLFSKKFTVWSDQGFDDSFYRMFFKNDWKILKIKRKEFAH